ncbi:hypothetical protein BurJ1DRAFT_3355 [Burkholderiales bacterium JOSHI_001]|nr:hypothetical protein BurJ1DRAFT_3355 [Burkholderiales bacterium JOSHI_001]
MKMKTLALILACILFGAGPSRAADGPQHQHHHPGSAPAEFAAPPSDALKDSRRWVRYPEPLRLHTLANMRDHLKTLGDIQAALAQGSFDTASTLAEQRLGMSSLGMHGAHEVAKYMPLEMQSAGSAMHRTASQFALVAKDASVTADLKPVLAALARLNDTCVACHAAFRLQ